MKLARLVDPRFKETLHKFIKEPLPIKVAFKLKGVMKKVDEEFEKYDECRRDALNRLGLKNEDGTLNLDDHGNVKFEPESMQQFVKELGELTSTEISLDKISVSDLGPNISMSVDELLVLDDLLTE